MGPIIESLVAVSLSLLVALACVGTGLLTLSRLGFRPTHISESLVFSAGLGFTVLVLSLTALGFLGFLYPAVAWALVAALLAAGAPTLRRFLPLVLWGVRLRLNNAGWPTRILLLVASAYALGYLLSGLTPTLDGDSMYGYLLLPREYALRHQIAVVDYAYGYYYPQNGQLISTLGFLLQGEPLAIMLVSTVMGVLSGLAVYSIGRSYFGSVAGIVGMVVFYGMFAFGGINGTGKVDVAWAFFDLLGIYAFAKWYFHDRRQARWLALAGLFLGIALGTKYSAAYTIAALGLGIATTLVSRRQRKVTSLLRDLAAFSAPIAIAGIWLGRTYLLTGNPIYPMFNSIILGDPAGQISLNQYDSFLFFPVILWDISMAPILGGIGRPVGPILLAAIPLLLTFQKVDWRIRHILMFCLFVGVLWYSGLQRPRHALSTLGLLSVVAGYSTALHFKYRRGMALTLVALSLVALSMNWVVWARNRLPMPETLVYLLGQQTREQFLQEKLGEYIWFPDYDVREYINKQLPLDSRLVGTPTSGAAYYIERPIYGRLLYGDSNIAETLCDLKAHDISHIWANFDVFNYLLSLNSGKQHPGYLLQNPGFRTDYLTELYSNGPQTIYQVRYPDTLDCSNVQPRTWYP